MKNIEWMAANSYGNCHAEGVHSLRLDDKVRAFIATPNHSLDTNDESNRYGPMSVGFHPHHCDIKITCLSGSIKNIIRKQVSQDSWDAKPYYLYRYNSQITNGKIGFTFLFSDFLGRKQVNNLEAGQSVELKANEIHTIFIPRYQEAIWLVEESMEDLDYKPLCWSNNPSLQSFDFSKLYYRPTIGATEKLLEMVRSNL